MINSFKELGEKVLEGLSPSERRRKFLLKQTIVPNEPETKDEDRDKYREIIINLDTEKEELEIKLGNRLWVNNREEFFGFELLGNNSKKTYFTSNNLHYHLLTIPDLLSYIDEKLYGNEFNEFSNYLIGLKDIFYDTSQEKSFFKLDRFKKEQKEKILQYLGDGNKVNYDLFVVALSEFVSKDILGTSEKDFVNKLNIFSLKIDSRYITETKFKDVYVNLVYYERQGRFFDEKESYVKTDKLCNVCNKHKLISGKVDIPTKFYVTSSPSFFENLKEKNAYKSFAICEDCYQDVMVGIKKIENNYSGKLFYKLNYYLIPKDIDGNRNYEKQLDKIQRIIAGNYDNPEDDLNSLKRIKRRDIKIDFLFWYKDQASFIVADSINDVYYSDLETIFNELKKLNQVYKQYFKYTPDLNTIYWLLFPNKNSHSKVDTKVYRKELLNLFDSIIKGRKINYSYLINKFNFIFRKRYFKGIKNLDEVIYNPLQMNILLSWFNRVTRLEGGFKVREGQSAIVVQDKDIKEFFEVHCDIYENNFYRQGLFMLGVLMNEILKEQKNKSSTILNKLDFDGLGIRRINKFVMDITENLNIYNKFRINHLLHAQMIDRLQGIENSSLKKDEVVFYILSGISFGRYLGYKYSQEKKNN